MPKKKDIQSDVQDAEVIEVSEPVTEADETVADDPEATASVAEPESPVSVEAGAVPSSEDDDDTDEQEEHHTSLSARVLQGLILIAIGGALALWGAPKLAPVLPEGLAPIARFLMPGQSEVKAEVEAVRSDLQSQITELAAKPSGGVSQSEIDSAIAAYDTSISTSLDAIRDQLGATDGQKIEARLSAIESRLTGVSAELSTMSDRLSLQITEDGAALSEEAAAKLTGYQAVIDGLKAQVEDLAATSGALSQKIDGISVASARRIKQAEDAATTKVTTTATTKLITDISSALDSGAPFRPALDGLVKVAEVEAPSALLNIADTGTTSWTALRSQFPDIAHAALRADTQASADGGVIGKLGAFLKNQVGSRSLERREGDGTNAVLSRIEDELTRGNLQTAMVESESLPDAPKAALTDWLSALDRLANAQSALTQLSSTLGVTN